MNEQWLVLWAGSHANWGRLEQDGAFGPHVETGQISSSLALSPEGARALERPEELRADEVMLDLTAELDAGSYCRTAHAPQPPAIRLEAPSPSGTARPLLLAEGPALLRTASEHVLKQLRGKRGVIAVPAAWRRHPWREALLAPWSEASWRVASWEECTAKASRGSRQISVAAGGWARVIESDIDLLLPTSEAVATAAGLAPVVRARMMTALSAAHGEAIQGCAAGAWFTDARLRGVIAEALQRRLDHVVVGGAASPVFNFAGANLNDRHIALAHARVRVDLPTLKDSDWWGALRSPGMLSLADGTGRVPGVDWPSRSTIFLGAQPAERRLHLSFQMSGCPSVIVTPPTLPMFGEKGALPPSPVLPVPAVLPPPPPRPPAPPPAPPPVVEDVALLLANYRVGCFRVLRPHRGLRARVDGEPRGVAQPFRDDASGPPEYSVEPSGLPQRALVRIDYEPETEA